MVNPVHQVQMENWDRKVFKVTTEKLVRQAHKVYWDLPDQKVTMEKRVTLVARDPKVILDYVVLLVKWV